MNENCRFNGTLTCTKLVQVGGDERYKRCYNYSDKTVVKGDCVGKCVANREVAFEFFSDDDFE